MGWLDGWERIEIPGRSGGNYTGDHLWRCVLHSTEGLSIESAVGAYTTGGVPPTVTIDPDQQRKAQHIDTDRSAYAVMNQPGGVETNRWRCVQCEIVMFADQAKAQQYGGLYVGDLTDQHYAFIRECLLELQADKPFTFNGPKFIHYPDSYGKTKYRMSFGEWEQFGGTCGHQHVPENLHGDPGELDRVRLFLPPAPPAPPPEEDTMTYTYVKKPGPGQVFLARRGESPLHVGDKPLTFKGVEALLSYQGDTVKEYAGGESIADAEGQSRKVLVLNSPESQQWFGI